jgi:hypothetical protein
MTFIIRKLKLFPLIKRHFIYRKMPHGLMSIRYLWTFRDSHILAHRALWWQSGKNLPRLLWLLLECLLYIRWVIISGPLCSLRYWRSARNTNPEDFTLKNLFALFQLTLGWCIHPKDCYRFNLLEHPHHVLNYVYDHEINAYHAQRNSQLNLNKKQLKILQDKIALTEFLGDKGIPVVPIIKNYSQYTEFKQIAEILPRKTKVFCKMRSGNQARGAFAAWPTKHGWNGKTFFGKKLETLQAVESAWKDLCLLDDALIQPYQNNHPKLEYLSDINETITVRLITHWVSGALECLMIVLEVPVSVTLKNGTKKIGYNLYQIDVQSGLIKPFPLAHNVTSDILQKSNLLNTNTILPYWKQLLEASFCAHNQFPGIWAIAWDWVITSDGPLLLEGNSGWGANTVQKVFGGWLKTTNTKYP